MITALSRRTVFAPCPRATANRMQRGLNLLLLPVLMICLGALRLHAQSGTLDTTFDPGTGVDLSVYSIAIRTNGQILIAGDFTSFDDMERVNVARINANGSRDDAFNPGAAADGPFPYVNAVALQAGGKLLMGGVFTNIVATNFARLDTNGSLDISFAVLADDSVNTVVVQTNGSIVIGGLFTHINGQSRAGIARLDSAGALDLSFSPGVSG